MGYTINEYDVLNSRNCLVGAVFVVYVGFLISKSAISKLK